MCIYTVFGGDVSPDLEIGCRIAVVKDEKTSDWFLLLVVGKKLKMQHGQEEMFQLHAQVA